MKGTFIAFEGGDGSGKDTQLARVKERLAGNPNVTFVREPGGTSTGEELRRLLLNMQMCPKSQILLFLAARAQLLYEVIIPALTAGKHVIANRFGLSTVAYQIYGNQQHDLLPFLQEATRFVVGDWQPDHYVFFDLAPEIALGRVKGREGKLDVFEQETIDYHVRALRGYHAHLHDFGRAHVIDGSPSIESVSTEVDRVMRELLPQLHL